MLIQEKTYSLPDYLHLQKCFWSKYHRISASINYRICGQLMIQPDLSPIEFQKRIKIINNFIVQNYGNHFHSISLNVSSENSKSNIKNQSDQFYLSKLKSEESILQAISGNSFLNRVQQWIATLIFNIQLRNDQYLAQIKEVYEAKQNASQEIQIFLMQQSKSNMQILLSIPVLSEIIEHKAQEFRLNTSNKNSHAISLQSLCLAETIQYLCEKNKIKASYMDDMKYIISQKNKIKTNLSLADIQNCNSIIFQPQNLTFFQKSLQNNFNFDLASITRIIYANYYKFQKPRAILTSQNNLNEASGQHLINRISKELIEKYSKNQIFSEKYIEVDRLYTLFLAIMEYCFTDVYIDWLKNLEPFIEQALKHQEISVQQLLESIQPYFSKFLSILPHAFPLYMNFIQKIYHNLLQKYASKNLSFQIMKKLIFNRFLLNISLFLTYEGIDQITTFNHKDRITNLFNQIKLLFYHKKIAENLFKDNYESQQKHKISRLIKSAQANEKILQKQLNSRMENKTPQLYIMEKHLKQEYNTIYTDLNFSTHQKSKYSSNLMNNNSFNHQNSSKKQSLHSKLQNQKSLSFSFVGQEVSYGSGININKSATDAFLSKENNSKPINYSSKHQQKKQIVSPKSHRTVHTQLSEHEQHQKDSIQLVWELVKLRREHGVQRREIEHKMKRRKQKRKQIFEYCSALHQHFMQRQKQLQKNLNRIRINIESY